MVVRGEGSSDETVGKEGQLGKGGSKGKDNRKKEVM